jgi:ATP-dependent helicase/nuclease subunit A
MNQPPKTAVEPVVDLAQRQLALDPTQSFIVSAPAGSGKTGLITQRVLRLLCSVENPEEILSITFTRKAAGEMSSRIHSALQAAAYEPRPTNEYDAQTWDLAAKAVARNNQLGWNLLEMPGRLRIQTIDGFCRYIASQFALETKLGALPEPSEQPQVHYQLAARNLLEKIEEDSSTGEQLALLLAHTGNDSARCERLLADMLGKREQWLPLIFDARDNQQYFQQVIDQIVGESLLQLHDALMPITGELLSLADFAASHLPADQDSPIAQLAGITELPDCSLDGIKHWKILLGLLLTQKFELRKSVTKKEGFPTDQPDAKKRMLEILNWCRNRPDIQALLTNAQYLPEAEINPSQQLMLDALGSLLPTLAAELDIVFKQQDQCDYPAITLAALEAIEPSPEDHSISDITLRLDYQLRHILVDEFQDTSGAQIKLLEHLIAGWQPDDGRTLFLVGDAMQSLYGFRNANVGLFINAQRHPVGPVQCTPLALSCNFRSQKGIIDWVNSTFSQAFPVLADISRGAVPYSPSDAFKESGSEPAVSFQGFTGDQYEQSEAEYIAGICKDLTANQPNESIAILVRGRSHLKSIVPALREAKLKWQAINITPLASRMPVIDLLSITRALLSPADKIPWLAMLRAPFCGLDSTDLLTITNSTANTGTASKTGDAVLKQLQKLSDSDSFSQLSDYGQAALLRVIPVLLNTWNNRARTSLRETVEQLWVELGGPATLTGSGDLSDVRDYLDLLEKWQTAGTVADWTGFQQAIEQLYAAPSPDNIDKDSQGIIQLMTIHKSKGLEFDHVILPGLTRTSGSDKKPLLHWCKHIDENNHMSLIMAPLGAHDDEDDSVYSYIKQEDGFKTRLENTRVLYVAATRAIRKLYLSASLRETNNQGWQTPGKGTLLAPIWKTIEQGILEQQYSVEIGSDQAKTKTEEQIASMQHLRRLPGLFKALAPALGSKLVGNEEPKSATDNPLEQDLSIRARLLGTVLHRTLKQIANEGIDNWPLQRIEQLSSAWAAQLKEQGILTTAVELESLIDAVSRMLADPVGQWILHSHTQAQCEQALGYYHAEQNRTGTSIIDRTFVDQGERWIIDYKFSKPGSAETEEQFKTKQTNAYQGQLRHYANLYKGLEDNPVRCALYFPQIPMFIEVGAE